MTASKFWKLLPSTSPCRVATSASTGRDEWNTVVPEKHKAASPCSTGPAKEACIRFKTRILNLVQRSGMAKKKTSQEQQRNDAKSDIVQKQSWLPQVSDDLEPVNQVGCTPEACGEAAEPAVQVGCTPEACGEAAGESEDMAMKLDHGMAPAGSSMIPVKTEASPVVTQKSLAQLARDSRKIDGKSLGDIAQEACELAKQQPGTLPHEMDPLEALELEWEESIFVNLHYEHRQKLRVLVGLPVQPRSMQSEPEEDCP